MIRAIMSETDVIKGLRIIGERIQAASKNRGPELQEVQPRLVAVSKTKSKELIIKAYEYGQRNFGENYVQELVEKGQDAEGGKTLMTARVLMLLKSQASLTCFRACFLPGRAKDLSAPWYVEFLQDVSEEGITIIEKCSDIKWHFIGRLQRNKVSKVLSVPGLYLVETVDSYKLATALDTTWAKEKGQNTKLKVMAQINTSGEEEKNGCTPEEAIQLVQHIVDKCPNLELIGLMTIGKFGYDLSEGPNPDFICLRNVRDEVCKALGIGSNRLELSMGMSDDFEHAIEMGSTNVRVGSSIFGHREKLSAPHTHTVTEGIKNVSVS